MPFGKAGHPNRKVIAKIFSDKGAEFSGIKKILWTGSPVRLILGWIAAQGQDVFDAARLDFHQYPSDFFFGVADAGQMGHACDVMRLLDMLNDVECLFAIPAARPIRAGDEVRIEFCQRRDCLKKILIALIGLRRKKFERIRAGFFLKDVDNLAHRKRTLVFWTGFDIASRTNQRGYFNMRFLFAKILIRFS